MKMVGDWYRKVQHQNDAEFYEHDKPLRRALQKLRKSPHWNFELLPHLRTGGAIGQIIRLTAKDDSEQCYLREIVHKPKKKDEDE